MKLFQIINVPFASMGVYSTQLNGFPVKNVAGIFLLGEFIISTAIYFLYEAETIEEYSVSFYISVTCTLILFVLIVFICKRKILIKFIDALGNNIETREFIEMFSLSSKF